MDNNTGSLDSKIDKPSQVTPGVEASLDSSQHQCGSEPEACQDEAMVKNVCLQKVAKGKPRLTSSRYHHD